MFRDGAPLHADSATAATARALTPVARLRTLRAWVARSGVLVCGGMSFLR
jgi:hypothetical protein